MQKVFRFKYEPCNGTCYAWDKTLLTELLKLSDNERKNTVEYMVKGHDHLCDNPDYSFGIDLDKNNEIFIAHFRTPEKTDIYTNKDFKTLVKDICSKVLETNVPKLTGSCIYGDNGIENLSVEILNACKDVVYRNFHQEYCPISIGD